LATLKVASIAAIVQEEPNRFYLIVGQGDHTCSRWELSESLVRKLVSDGFNIAMRNK
jgi:hypothetical protein